MKRSLLIVTLLIAVTACTATQPTATPTELSVGSATIARESRLLDRGRDTVGVGDLAPDFSFTLPDGSTTRLSDLRGRPVVLNFWATWCLPCVEELPVIEQAYLAAQGDLVVLAINRNELPAAIARFAATIDVSFPLIPDLSGAIGDRYTVTSLPTTLFIHRDGTLSARHIGVLNAQQLSKALEELR